MSSSRSCLSIKYSVFRIIELLWLPFLTGVSILICPSFHSASNVNFDELLLRQEPMSSHLTSCGSEDLLPPLSVRRPTVSAGERTFLDFEYTGKAELPPYNSISSIRSFVMLLFFCLRLRPPLLGLLIEEIAKRCNKYKELRTPKYGRANCQYRRTNVPFSACLQSFALTERSLTIARHRYWCYGSHQMMWPTNIYMKKKWLINADYVGTVAFSHITMNSLFGFHVNSKNV